MHNTLIVSLYADNLKNDMIKTFEIILGINAPLSWNWDELEWKKNIHLFEEMYKNIIKKFKMSGYKIVLTPLDSNKVLKKEDDSQQANSL